MSPIKSRELISPCVRGPPHESEELEFIEDFEFFRNNEFTEGKKKMSKFVQL